MDSHALPKSGDIERSGTFTNDVTKREYLRKAGIPVSLILPAMQSSFLPSHNTILFTVPDELGIKRNLASGVGLVHEGVNAVPKVEAMRESCRALISCTNPFSTVPSSSTKDGDSGPARCKHCRKTTLSFTPNEAQRENRVQHVHRNNFAEPQTPHTPPTPDIWVMALGTIDINRRPRKEDIPKGGYAFQTPACSHVPKHGFLINGVYCSLSMINILLSPVPIWHKVDFNWTSYWENV
ncbi:hypothetical protein VNI00_015558 [Paramarasmius palmivorus]|uniref:Uncharacterized protein n=1 Tax=Paramarasmius palmivorus TaxID=297713 RepID=A0AAW0BK90_9AGAR